MNFTFFKTLVILFLIVSFSCKEKLNTEESLIRTSNIKYAKGFDIVSENGNKKLIIKNPYKNSKKVFSYILYKKSAIKSINKSINVKIEVPIQELVVTSTTHIPMIELLNEELSIIGFPNTKYISSKKTRKLIDQGKIIDIGKENSLNTEILLDIEPQLVIGYGVSNADKTLATVQKAGIPVIYNGDWLEETPLGKAEWIKFFGVLFDKEKLANSIFKKIESNYLEAKNIALKSNKKLTVLSGAIMSKDIWNLPAGNSFVSKFLKDANLDYLWRKTKGNGSLSLSFESVFEKGINADFWIAPGYFTSKNQLLKSNKLYAKFKSFINNNIYTSSNRKGETGGVLYYELATTRPDLVLKDIIKITNPKLLPDYKTTFFEKMK